MLMWEIMGLTMAFFVLLGAVAFRVRVGSAFHKGMKRCVYASLLLFFCSLLPGMQMGVNALAIAAVALLGVPGLALLQVIALMP